VPEGWLDQGLSSAPFVDTLTRGAGNLVIAGAGFLGGHLALHRGTARRPMAEPGQSSCPGAIPDEGGDGGGGGGVGPGE
jgi:hypothetical protein